VQRPEDLKVPGCMKRGHGMNRNGTERIETPLSVRQSGIPVCLLGNLLGGTEPAEKGRNPVEGGF